MEDFFEKEASPANISKPKESPLKSLEKDLIYYSESIHEIALEIIQEEVSAYPIFIAHQHEVALGEVILDKEELGTNWTINVATAEDLVEKGLISRKKEDGFYKTYKDPKTYMCLLVIVPEGANFVFYPYK